MPPSKAVSKTVVTSIVTIVLASFTFWDAHRSSKKKQRLRQKLPYSLNAWRSPGGTTEAEEQVWVDLQETFRHAGYALWTNSFLSRLVAPGNGEQPPVETGFGYVIPSRRGTDGPGSIRRLHRFDYANPLQRAARTSYGRDVIIRVVALGTEGQEHLKILRKIATGKHILTISNHALPMVAEFHFEDIIFGIFPKVGGTVWQAYDYWAQNSTGDVIEMIMQMLEALAYIHCLGIAHRDAFHDNFVIQWHPESLMMISPSRPRVYLIDFEVAIQFPPECPVTERTVTGYPLGGSFVDLVKYARPHAPEFASGIPYDPFKLDVWQLGKSFENFKSTIPEVDKILADMIIPDFLLRLGAAEILDELKKIVGSIPPCSMHIKPVVLEMEEE